VRPVFALWRTSVGRLPFTHHFIRIVKTKSYKKKIFFFIRPEFFFHPPGMKKKIFSLCKIAVECLYWPPSSYDTRVLSLSLLSILPLLFFPFFRLLIPVSPFSLALPHSFYVRRGGGRKESKWGGKKKKIIRTFSGGRCVCVCAIHR
jgi:hypothetical protein